MTPAKKDASSGAARVFTGEAEQVFPDLRWLDDDGKEHVGITLKPKDTVTLADPKVEHHSLKEA